MRNRSRFFPTALAAAVIALMLFALVGTAGAARKNDKEPKGQSTAPGTSGDKGGGPPAGKGNKGGNSGGGGSDSTPPSSQGDTSDSGSGPSGAGQGAGQGGGSGDHPATSGSGGGSGKGGSGKSSSGKGGSAKGRGAGPNRGFIQVEGENIDDIPQNKPHQGCVFTIEFRNFDGTGLVTATLTLINPTPGGSTSATATLEDDPAGGGHDLDATIVMSLSNIPGIEDVEPLMIAGKPSLHVRLDVTTPWGEKHHVFWAMNCPPQPPPPPGLGAITIVKDAIPNSSQPFDFGGNLGPFTLVDDRRAAGTDSITFDDLDAGTYTATELGPPEGWMLDDVSCVDGTDSETSISGATATIDLAVGEHVTCTFTNKRQGPPPPPPELAAITIIKNAVPDGDQAFTYSGTLGGFTLVDDGTGVANTITFDELEAGSYSVTEDEPPTGWSLDSLACDDPDDGTTISGATASLDLDVGEHVVCTYVNTLTLGQPPTEPPPPGAPPTGPPPGAPGGPPLAFTGLDATVLILTAAALFAVGMALLLAASRREEAARRG
jgi:hypothetical protein